MAGLPRFFCNTAFEFDMPCITKKAVSGNRYYPSVRQHSPPARRIVNELNCSEVPLFSHARAQQSIARDGNFSFL